MSTRLEPQRSELEAWQDGVVNIHTPIPFEYANWAYWYLGYDDPMIRVGDIVTNGVIQKITDACVLRLKELDDE